MTNRELFVEYLKNNNIVPQDFTEENLPTLDMINFDAMQPWAYYGMMPMQVNDDFYNAQRQPWNRQNWNNNNWNNWNRPWYGPGYGPGYGPYGPGCGPGTGRNCQNNVPLWWWWLLLR